MLMFAFSTTVQGRKSTDAISELDIYLSGH